MVANILHTDTPSTQGVGSKGQTISSESSHVAYQIKADDAGSNMVASILPKTHPQPREWGQKVKLYLFLKVVVFLDYYRPNNMHINNNVLTRAALVPVA